MRKLLAAFMLVFLVGCAGSPTSAWISTCDTYYETLRSVNDALEIGTIDPDDDVIASMKDAKKVLSPICTGETPPEGADREGLQELLDAILLELVKAEKGLSS